MGKHSKPGDDEVPETVSDDMWTRIVTAGAAGENGDQWMASTIQSAGNAEQN